MFTSLRTDGIRSTELRGILDCRLVQHCEWEVPTSLSASIKLKQNTWMISSSMIIGNPKTGGLSWWQSWLCVWIGYTISGTFICMTGRIGATYHISFPVVTRASFGIWGSLWPVFNRAAMACVRVSSVYEPVAGLMPCRSGTVCSHGSEVFISPGLFARKHTDCRT